jgi:low affinity Fe/Cu permease
MITDWRRYLVRRVTGALSTRRIILGVALIWLITGAIFHFSYRWLWLLSTGTSIVTVVILFLILTEHHRQVKTLSEKLNQLYEDLKTQEKTVLRRLHTRHRNGEDS